MFARKWLSILLVLCMAGASRGEDTSAQTQGFVERYLAAWSLTDARERRAQLEAIFLAEGVHRSPNSYSQGIDAIDREIAGFQQQLPGARATASNILRTGNHVVFDFVLKSADGKPIASGVDYMELTDQGKLVKVIGFY